MPCESCRQSVNLFLIGIVLKIMVNGGSLHRMRNYLSVIILLFVCTVYSQETNHSANITYCAGLTHQHKNFFQKPFSYTGLEVSAIIHHHFMFGIYGSTFLSTLTVETATIPLDLFIWQTGMLFGISTPDTNLFLAGLLFNTGYISVIGNKKSDPEIRNCGLVWVPQVYGELNVSKWLRLRIGAAYDFYKLTDKSYIATSDLQSISFNFGFVFGRFSNSRSCF